MKWHASKYHIGSLLPAYCMWFDANDLGIFICVELNSISFSSLQVLGFARAVAVSCHSDQYQISPNSFTMECEIFCCRHL